MNNILISIYNRLKNYCIENNFSIDILIFVLNLFYKIYKTSYFKNFNKNNYGLNLNSVQEHNFGGHISKLEQNILSENNETTKKVKDEKIYLLMDEQENIKYNNNLNKKNKKRKKKNKDKTIDHLYNIFNDKIRNYISYSKFTKEEAKVVKNIINDSLNKYKEKYEDNINDYIYNSSDCIFNKIEKYIEKEILHDIDYFNIFIMNILKHYKMFCILVSCNATQEFIDKYK